MLKNYFKIALRNILKDKAFSFINIMGLAIGIASTVLISHYVRYERSYESYFSNGDNIMRITLDLFNGSEYIETDCETYQLVGPQLKEQWPEVLDYARFMNIENVQVRVENEAYYEPKLYLADPSAFSVFDYKIISGNPVEKFDEPRKIVLTESTAIKYFGKTDVVSEYMEFSISEEPYEVVGVIEDIPQNTHLKFNILISHETIPTFWSSYKKHLWGANNEYTYLLVQDNVDLADFNKKLVDYTNSIEEIEDEMLVAEWIKDIHLYSNKSFEPEVNGSAQTVDFMLIVSIFVILLAWVNYVNLSTARATERAREVGIRKVVGSNKSQLLKQFLLESFIVNLLAATLAFTMVQLGIPLFKQLTGQALSLNIAADPVIWIIFVAIIILGTCFSGLYPSLVLSSFKPVTVLKGKFTNSSQGSILRKSLVVFQYLATVVLITVSLGVNNQMQFLSEKDLGVNLDNTLVLKYPESNTNDSITWVKSKVLVDRINTLSNVKLVSQSGALPGSDLNELGTNSGVKRIEDRDKPGGSNYYIYSIDHNYIEALSMNLIAGQNYVDGPNQDRIIINKRAVETLGYSSPEDAIGKKTTFWTRNNGEPAEIIGVIDNYHQRSPKEVHIPMIFRYYPLGSYFLVKMESENSNQTLSSVKEIWNDVYPDVVLDHFFLDDQYNQQYVNEQRFASITSLFTVLSILIASMGLFGLSSFTIVQRTKEIGIRKALGASVQGIVGLLSKDFLKLVLISGVLAIPIAYKLIDMWLANYAYHIEVKWWLFVIPLVFILLVASLTVIGQTVKSALNNPVDSLRYE